MDLSESTSASAQIFPVCLGPAFTVAPSTSDTNYTCIVCQEEHRQTGEQPAMVLASFVQLSTVLRWKNDKTATEEPLPETWPMLIDGGRRIGTHISTCGHVMHFQCWQQHFDSLLGRERRRSYRYQIRRILFNQSIDQRFGVLQLDPDRVQVSTWNVTNFSVLYAKVYRMLSYLFYQTDQHPGQVVQKPAKPI